jgi:hypothetical protein
MTINRRAGVAALALLLAGCGAQTVRTVAAPSSAPPPPMKKAGLEGVLGQNARALTSLFGRPDQDLREANGRKLQFGNGVCVLDAYLYARKSGQEPVVTWLDARRPDGADADRAACVTALTRK